MKSLQQLLDQSGLALKQCIGAIKEIISDAKIQHYNVKNKKYKELLVIEFIDPMTLLLEMVSTANEFLHDLKQHPTNGKYVQRLNELLYKLDQVIDLTPKRTQTILAKTKDEATTDLVSDLLVKEITIATFIDTATTMVNIYTEVRNSQRRSTAKKKQSFHYDVSIHLRQEGESDAINMVKVPTLCTVFDINKSLIPPYGLTLPDPTKPVKLRDGVLNFKVGFKAFYAHLNIMVDLHLDKPNQPFIISVPDTKTMKLLTSLIGVMGDWKVFNPSMDNYGGSHPKDRLCEDTVDSLNHYYLKTAFKESFIWVEEGKDKRIVLIHAISTDPLDGVFMDDFKQYPVVSFEYPCNRNIEAAQNAFVASIKNKT